MKTSATDIIIVNIEDVRNMASNKGFLMFCMDKKIDQNSYSPDDLVSITRSEWIRYGSDVVKNCLSCTQSHCAQGSPG